MSGIPAVKLFPLGGADDFPLKRSIIKFELLQTHAHKFVTIVTASYARAINHMATKYCMLHITYALDASVVLVSEIPLWKTGLFKDITRLSSGGWNWALCKGFSIIALTRPPMPSPSLLQRNKRSTLTNGIVCLSPSHWSSAWRQFLHVKKKINVARVLWQCFIAMITGGYAGIGNQENFSRAWITQRICKFLRYLIV